MSVFLYALGCVCVVCGAAAIFFGIPVKEFSFGDTLIGAGTTGLVGGLILVGLGATVSQLQRIGEMLGARPLARSGRPLEPFEQPAGGAPARVPFPPKPKLEPRERPVEVAAAPRAVEQPSREPEFSAPPSLHNPDVPLMAEDEAERLPLSPRNGDTPRHEVAGENIEPPADEPEQASFEPAWRPPPPPVPPPARTAAPSYFENMWPAAERGAPPPPPPREEPRSETIARAPMPEPMPPAEDMRDDMQDEARDDVRDDIRDEMPEEAPPVAILKSGVVDGMGYTLYVDGSIEAELPDGTLRFASINELRAHLEKNA
jgi:hypothetical protein